MPATNHDPFEQRLRQTPLREIPPAWSSEILTAASAQRGVPAPKPAKVAGNISVLRMRLRDLFWPCPQAWCGLAAAWVGLLLANMATESRFATPPPVAGERASAIRAGIRDQHRFLAEMNEPAPVTERANSKGASLSPRTECWDNTIAI